MCKCFEDSIFVKEIKSPWGETKARHSGMNQARKTEAEQAVKPTNSVEQALTGHEGPRLLAGLDEVLLFLTTGSCVTFKPTRLCQRIMDKKAFSLRKIHAHHVSVKHRARQKGTNGSQ